MPGHHAGVERGFSVAAAPLRSSQRHPPVLLLIWKNLLVGWAQAGARRRGAGGKAAPRCSSRNPPLWAALPAPGCVRRGNFPWRRPSGAGRWTPAEGAPRRRWQQAGGPPGGRRGPGGPAPRAGCAHTPTRTRAHQSTRAQPRASRPRPSGGANSGRCVPRMQVKEGLSRLPRPPLAGGQFPRSKPWSPLSRRLGPRPRWRRGSSALSSKLVTLPAPRARSPG